MDLIVGTFNSADLFTIHFSPPSSIKPLASLSIIRPSPAISGHSWLALSRNQKYLYCTAWTKPKPSIAAYRVKNSGRDVQFINAKHVRNLSGYVCVSPTHVYSVGGATGEAFRLNPDGSIGELVQELDFEESQGTNMSEERGAVPHGDFGGLRHGAHSCDLSPDGKSLYIADIGRNCIWTYSVNNNYGPSQPRLAIGSWTSEDNTGVDVAHLVLATKHVSPRSYDGPRHTWPHPNGKVLYSLQEHSSFVDLFAVGDDGLTLQHVQGVKIIPTEQDRKDYWADEVRFSTGPDASRPRYLYASTRGLKAETKGYVAVFELKEDGMLASEQAVHIWQTPTSGGIANAIEPAPWRREHGDSEYLAMTDSEEGLVFMLHFDGKEISEVARLSLGKTETEDGGEGEVVKAATAVWFGEKLGELSF